MPRSGKVAAAIEQVLASALAMRAVLWALALAAGHQPDRLSWEFRPGASTRWDLVHVDGRWLGGVVLEQSPGELSVRQAARPPSEQRAGAPTAE